MATFMEVLDTSIANVALPHIAGNLGVTPDEATWVLTSYLVANAIVLPLSAWLSEMIGRKRFYMMCVALFTCSSFLCGFAPNLAMLVFFRILQGLGGGGLQPSEQAILADTFPQETRHGVCRLRLRSRRRAGHRPDAGRLYHRQHVLAVDLLYQHPDRHPLPDPDQPPGATIRRTLKPRARHAQGIQHRLYRPRAGRRRPRAHCRSCWTRASASTGSARG